MKKLLSIALLGSFIITPFGHAQQAAEIENVVADWIFFDNTGDVINASNTQIRNFTKNGTETIYYNALGEPLIQRDGNIVKTNLSYGADGKTVNSYVEFGIRKGVDGDFVDTAYEYELGPDGKFRVKTQVSPYGKITYTYDGDGNLTSFNRLNLDGNGNVTASSTQESSYINGKLTSRNEIFKDANGNLTQLREISFDAEGNEILRNTIAKDSNGNIRYTAVEEHEYDENGNKILSTAASMDANGNLSGSNLQSYEYDENGKITRHNFAYTSKTGVVSSSETVYAYNEDGNQTSYIRTGGAGDSVKRDYEYDEDGNKISDISVQKDANGSLRSSTEQEFEYDEQGNKISWSFVSVNNYGSGNVTNTARYSYDRAYDENGKQLSYLEKRLDTNGEVLSKRNIIPKYNEEGESIGEESISLDLDGNVTGYNEYLYDYSNNNYEHSSTSKDADGNIISISKYGTYDYASATFSSDGEVTYFSGTGIVNYTKNNEDGSKRETSLTSVYTDEDGTGESAINSTNFKSLVNTYDTKAYDTAGDYTGYQKSDIDYDDEGSIDVATILNYTGAAGSEAYSGKKEYSGYTYNDLEYTTGYSLTEYDMNNDVITTKVISNIQYDYTGQKTQWNYEILDVNGDVTESGIKYAD